MKALTTSILAATPLTVTGSGEQEISAKEKRQPSASQKAPMPPCVNLQTAVFQGNLKAIRQHIKAGSDLNEKDPIGGSSPLIAAATFGKTEVARALIEAGADVNYKNNEGLTPLHTAAFHCRTGIVEALLDKGADKNLRSNAGSTALEAVAGPFDDVKDIYDYCDKVLGPLGLELDYEQIKMTRPKIAEILR